MEKWKYEVSYSLDELEEVAEKIEEIADRVKAERRRRSEISESSYEELMGIVSLLVGGSSSLEIIAICGIGVTGEDTLARVVQELLLDMKAEFSRSSSEDELIERFSQILGRRRYLIWVDDVRSCDVLERLKTALPDHGNGSRIIFTTRSSSDLARIADHVHEMSMLDDDQTWNVIRERIFKGDPCPFQLEPIGKSIARSCGGHQLSIAVVSGILAADQSETTWEDVSENIEIASDKVDEILHLSYIYLPRRLRPCLLYLGVFQKGYVILVSTLVRLWVAEGIVSESTGSESSEETGEEYVEDLVSRSLVFVYGRKSNGRIRSVIVHDLVRGMCLRQAHIDNFNLHLDRVTPGSDLKEMIKSCRRASNSIYLDECLRGVYGSTIRTLFLHLWYGGELDLRCWRMGNVRLLRILSLLDVNRYQLSDGVFELFHLRYLAMYWDSNIPEAISNLENLQTLFIRHEEIGGVVEKLPEGIWRMPQLRHLCIISFKFPTEKEPSPALEDLQTLSRIVDFVCSRENLKMFPNLKKLNLLYTKNLSDVVEDYELHNLVYLQKLEVLKIKTDSSIGDEHKLSWDFPPTLKKLSLRGLQLFWEGMKIIASLPKLEVLNLRNHACVGETWETIEGGFSRLFYLRIEESNLENWITKSDHFPRLGWLVLLHCSRLLEVPYAMADVPTLKLLHLDDTQSSLRRSAEQIRQDRHSLGHDPLYIKVD